MNKAHGVTSGVPSETNLANPGGLQVCETALIGDKQQCILEVNISQC
jgi:hypothetical protein